MKLFHKKEVWRPTVCGSFVLLILTSLIGLGLISRLYPFLAQQQPVSKPDLIIIEGWLEDSELVHVLAAAEPGALFVTTGGPVDLGADLFEEKDYAELTTVRLLTMGVPAGSIITASAPKAVKDRTYTSALAVRDTLKQRGLLSRPANLYSLGAHSRRSFLLYRLAFGPDAPLGVVALNSVQFDLEHWWQSSLAFKHVVVELISYVYVQFTRWQY